MLSYFKVVTNRETCDTELANSAAYKIFPCWCCSYTGQCHRRYQYSFNFPYVQVRNHSADVQARIIAPTYKCSSSQTSGSRPVWS